MMETTDVLVNGLNELIADHELIIAEHQQIVDEHTAIINDFKAALSRIVKDVEHLEQPKVKVTLIKSVPIPKKKTTKKKSPSANNLLKNTVVSYIQEKDLPLSAEKLRSKYNKVSGKDITTANFSPRIAELKAKEIIGKYINLGAGIKDKFLYALPHMFEDMKAGILLPAYTEKLKAGHQAQLL